MTDRWRPRPCCGALVAELHHIVLFRRVRVVCAMCRVLLAGPAVSVRDVTRW